MFVDQIIHSINEGEIAPFYFLYGPEIFYRVEIVQALKNKLITPANKDFNLENFEARESSVGDWIGAAETLSFLGGIKLIVVRNLHDTTLEDSDQKLLIDYVTNPGLDSCLVITADKADQKRKLYKNLTTQPGALCCSAPQEAVLLNWLKIRAKPLGYNLSSEAARKMLNSVGAKPGVLAKELEKVMTYAGKESKITESIVAEVVGEIKIENAFLLTEALKEKKAEKALLLLKNQLDQGEDPIKILGLIAWQFRTLWEVKHYQAQKYGVQKIAKQMSAKPFLVEKAMQYTKNFNQSKLREGMKHLYEADRELKTSGKDPQGVLETLLLRICSG
jgi:DNA polymerase III subunit delta